MEFRTRERTVLNVHQENVFAAKAKQATLKATGQEPPKRAVLGDLSSNVLQQQQQHHQPVAKAKAQIFAEPEKKTVAVRPITRSYKNVSAKVDTGHANKSQVSIKASKENVPRGLSREESLTRATAKTSSITVQLRQTKISNGPVLKSSREPSVDDAKKKEVRSDKYSILRKYSETKEVSAPVLKSYKKESYSTELLEGVEDIDSGEGNSPILMSIYVKDIYNYLMHLETEYPIGKKHLANQVFMTPKMRATLVDWLVEVHEQFNLMLETLHMTVALIDRYLQNVNTVQRNQIQLVGITAMFIACKYEEMHMPDIGDFVYITDNTYSKSEIMRCERAMLSELGFCLGRPLPAHFERRFIKAAKVNAKTHYLAKYLIDLSLVEYEMAHLPPSKMAAAAVCLAISVLSPHNNVPRKCWSPTLVHYSGYKYDAISPIIKSMAALAISTSAAPFKAVTNKYNSSRHGRVPSYPELRGSLIKSIACESPKA